MYNIMNEYKIVSDNCVHNYVDPTLLASVPRVFVFGWNDSPFEKPNTVFLLTDSALVQSTFDIMNEYKIISGEKSMTIGVIK